jgi:SAM-dependent methyltransferase
VSFLFTQRQRADSFGDNAELYDRVRPQYPAELVDALLKDQPTTVLDVGCGTGIASRLFFDRGCDVVGLEPDERMAAVARRYGIPVEAGNFETWDRGSRQFDLLIAAQSWHWVDPDAGAIKAADVLRPGGRIGLFWNQAFPGEAISEGLRRTYAECEPELGNTSVLLGERDVSLYAAIAEAARSTQRWDDVVIEDFGHDAVYSTDAWLELTATHSDHHTLPPERLHALLSIMRKEIDRGGGHVPVHYVSTLITGTTRSAP